MHPAIFFAASLTASGFWTAKDPFVGRWRLDVSRSTIVDQMRVEDLGSNKYGFSFEGAVTETVVADGTEQPGLPGTTLAVKVAGDGTLTVVRKQEGRTVVSANWKLSDDGRTLSDAFTSLQEDGSSLTVDYVYKRTSGTSGFAGTWESTTKPVGLKLELEIKPYGNRGLSFASPGSNKSVIFDGLEHSVPASRDASTLSGRRRGAHVIEYSEKTGGKLARMRDFELSADGRTLTETLRTPGHTSPDVFVFDRE
jgi:hypothetical protein